MAWSTPRTWATLEAVTAANMNTYVSDDLSWLGGNATTPSKSRPHCRVYDDEKFHAAPSSGDWIDVAFDHVTTDVGPSAMYTQNASYVSIPADGFWLLSAYAQWTTNDATGVRGIALASGAVSSQVPSGTIFAMSHAPGSGAVRSKVSASVTTLVQLSANTKVYCSLYQSSGIQLAVSPIVLSAVYVMV